MAKKELLLLLHPGQLRWKRRLDRDQQAGSLIMPGRGCRLLQVMPPLQGQGISLIVLVCIKLYNRLRQCYSGKH